jgi:hypothetical protein
MAFAVFFYLINTEKPITPCMPEGNPGRCYYVTEDMCDVVWDNATTACEAYIKSLSLAPGRLTGPIEFKCKLAHFDRAFRMNRKTGEALCDQQHLDLQDWVKRNDFPQ